jgi:hypothetical protein
MYNPMDVVWYGMTEYCWEINRDLVVEQAWNMSTPGSSFDVHLLNKIFT